MAAEQHGSVPLPLSPPLPLSRLTWHPGIYEPFDVVTSRALEHALAEHGLQYDERKIVQIMAAYNRLHEYAIPCCCARVVLIERAGSTTRSLRCRSCANCPTSISLFSATVRLYSPACKVSQQSPNVHQLPTGTEDVRHPFRTLPPALLTPPHRW